jgi:hypothetical protein
MTMTVLQIARWCEDNLFGNRIVDGKQIELTPTQQAIKRLAVEIIQKWEDREK